MIHDSWIPTEWVWFKKAQMQRMFCRFRMARYSKCWTTPHWMLRHSQPTVLSVGMLTHKMDKTIQHMHLQRVFLFALEKDIILKHFQPKAGCAFMLSTFAKNCWKLWVCVTSKAKGAPFASFLGLGVRRSLFEPLSVARIQKRIAHTSLVLISPSWVKNYRWWGSSV